MPLPYFLTNVTALYRDIQTWTRRANLIDPR
jgi:hypothetical protein